MSPSSLSGLPVTKSANSVSTREMPPARGPVVPLSEIQTPYPAVCAGQVIVGIGVTSG